MVRSKQGRLRTPYTNSEFYGCASKTDRLKEINKGKETPRLVRAQIYTHAHLHTHTYRHVDMPTIHTNSHTD